MQNNFILHTQLLCMLFTQVFIFKRMAFQCIGAGAFLSINHDYCKSKEGSND